MAEEKKIQKELILKVSQKRAVSLYGLGKFPVTLYKDQWEALLERKNDLLAFIKENEDQLRVD